MAKWQEELDTQTKLYKMYLDGLDYQAKIGIRHSIPNNIRFFEGNQWPTPTENTKNLPRPVINIIRMICRSKKSAILSSPVKIHFKSYTQGVNLSRLNSFAQGVLKELGQDNLDKLAIDDGVKKGSYFYHYYWDKSAVDLNGIMDGGVRCELIDPLNIFFSNPAQLDEQKQKWILIATHLDLDELLAVCDKDPKINPSLLENDLNDDGTITLLTRYFRINGEVYCEKATKSQIIKEPFMIAPPRNKNDGDIGYIRANLYPIVCGFYEKRNNSIYGISEIEGLIPNQKAINFNVAMSLLNAQECAWGKYVALPNALKGQRISNVPGQVLIDYSGTGDGIKKLQEQPLSQVPMDITSTIIELTKSSSGTAGIMNGELQWSNMSGAAIAQLQAQAQLPIEELREEFWEVKRKQGLVIAQFIRLYFYKKPFITIINEDGRKKEVFDYFSSRDYENAIFDISVEASGISRPNSSSAISMLDNCLSKGVISLETYIRAYPDSSLTNKEELLMQIEEEKQSEIYKLRQELEKLRSKKS